MSHTVLDGGGTLRYVRSLGAGTAGDPLRMVFFGHEDADVDDGVIFTHSDVHTIANNGVLLYLLKTPASPAHIELLGIEVASADSPITIGLFEDAVVSNNGTAEILYNNNRQSATASQALLYENPTVTDDGVALRRGTSTGDKSIGGSDKTHTRIILKQSANYLLRFENRSGSTTDLYVTLVIGED